MEKNKKISKVKKETEMCVNCQDEKNKKVIYEKCYMSRCTDCNRYLCFEHSFTAIHWGENFALESRAICNECCVKYENKDRIDRFLSYQS